MSAGWDLTMGVQGPAEVWGLTRELGLAEGGGRFDHWARGKPNIDLGGIGTRVAEGEI